MRKPRSPQSSSPALFKIAPFDCPTRFLVESESRPDNVHLVDLDAEDNRVCECSCEDWEFRNKDWLNIDGAKLRYAPYECKHIKQVKMWLAHKQKIKSAPDI